MPNQRTINYRRRSFDQWKNKVKKHLPGIVLAFYEIASSRHIDYEKHRLLGSVIKDINDPFYIINGLKHKNQFEDAMHETSMEILLRIQVEELFHFIAKNNPKTPI